MRTRNNTRSLRYLVTLLSVVVTLSTIPAHASDEIPVMNLKAAALFDFKGYDRVFIGDTDHEDAQPRLLLAQFLPLVKMQQPAFDCLFLEEPSDLDSAVHEYMTAEHPQMSMVLNPLREWQAKLDVMKGYTPNESGFDSRTSFKKSLLDSARANHLKVYGMDMSLNSPIIPEFLRAFKLMQSSNPADYAESLKVILIDRTQVFADNIKSRSNTCHKFIVFTGSAHLSSGFNSPGFEHIKSLPALVGGKSISIILKK